MDERKEFQDDSPKKQDELPHLKELLKRQNLMEIGRKGVTPFVKILHRYKNEVTPYIEAIKIGCDAASKELSNVEGESSQASKNVYNWFQEAGQFLDESKNRLNQNDASSFLDFIKDQSAKRPVMMFSTSYLLGVIAGRLSKKQYNETKTNSLH